MRQLYEWKCVFWLHAARWQYCLSIEHQQICLHVWGRIEKFDGAHNITWRFADETLKRLTWLHRWHWNRHCRLRWKTSCCYTVSTGQSGGDWHWSTSMSVHFDERSGVVPCKTPWGCWYQTMEEVFIEVGVPHGTSAKEVRCRLGARDVELHVKGKEIIKVTR